MGTSLQLIWYGDAFELIRRLQDMSQEVTFRLCHDMHFPVSEAGYCVTQSNTYAVCIPVMGLLGHHGVLPTYYQTFFTQAEHTKKSAWSDFLGVFQHRIVELYYQAWHYMRPTLSYYATTTLQPSALDRLLGAVAGVVLPEVLPDRSLLRYAGLLCRRPMARLTVETILQDYFKLPMRVAPFQLGQVLLSDQERTRIGRHGAHHQLGKSACLGAKLVTCQNHCTVFIGPIDAVQFEMVLPDTPLFYSMCRFMRYLISAAIQVRVCVLIQNTAVPWWRLCTHNPARLGLNTWCRTNPFKHTVMSWRHNVTYTTRH